MELFKAVFVLSLAFIDRAAAFDMPPSISITFKDNYYIPEDNSKLKEWQCSASGATPIRYEWKKDGITVRSNQYVTVDETTGKLSILKSQYPTDFGKYQCFAHNNVGTAMSVAFNLQRTFIGSFSDTIQKNLDPVEQYHNVSLKCTGRPKCVPGSQCELEWKKGVGVKDSVQEEKRIAIDKDGTLHFLYVRVEDQSTLETPYSCVIGNEEMKAYFKGANIIMPVRHVETPTGYRPILLSSKEAKGLVGGEAELECVFASYPLPDITWKVNGVTINHVPGKYEFDNPLIMRKLKIRQLTFDDEKLYTCTASNKHGSGNAQVLLNVTSKPFFKPNEILTSVVMPTGKDATFTCKMYSDPNERPPTAPQWFRNGNPIPESQIGPDPSQKYLLSPDKSVLTIKNVQKEPAPGDNSAIMCKAGNVIFNSNEEDMYSETYADATLVVIDEISVQVLSNLKTELKTTEPFSMAFSATTDPNIPQLYYKWRLIRDNNTVYDDTQLRSQPFVSFNADKTNLTILPENAMGDSDFEKIMAVVGIYEVVIFHDYDTVTRKFEAYTNIAPATKAPVVSSAGFDLWIIGVILGVIVLFIVIFFIICTLYRNRGGQYLVDKKEVAAGHDPRKELLDSGFVDLSRADDAKPPLDRVSLTDEVKPLESDEDSMSGDYVDDADTSKFNEDGSFIGVYMGNKGQGQNQSMV